MYVRLDLFYRFSWVVFLHRLGGVPSLYRDNKFNSEDFNNMAVNSRSTLKNYMNRDLNKSGARKKVANFSYSAYQYIRDLIDSVVFADGSPSETAVAWDDLRVPAQNTKLNPTKSEPAFEAFIDGVYSYHFGPANADDESLHFSAQLPHSYKLGTNLDAHIHWSPSTTNTK